MASNKRRRLNEEASVKDMSAFAARRRLQGANDFPESIQNSPLNKQEGPNAAQSDPLSLGPIANLGSARHTFREGFDLEPEDGSEYNQPNTESISEAAEEGDDLVTTIERKSRASRAFNLPDQHVTQLTTVNLYGDSYERLNDGTHAIKLAPGEKLVVLGEYGIVVTSGQITIMGATLSASDTVYIVYASSSHSLPVIRCRASDDLRAEVRLHQHDSGLRSLGHLNPLFAGLWNDESKSLKSERGKSSQKKKASIHGGGSFQILVSTEDSPRKVLNPLTSPPEWNEMLSKSVSGSTCSGTSSVTMICGPKSSGKSTYGKLLTNCLLTSGASVRKRAALDSKHNVLLVAYLDIDPGQPEFSPPGQLSLVLLSKPILGPPYSHPTAINNEHKVVRAHSIAATSPSADPSFYIKCVVDLLSHYSSIQSHSPCSLVINTPGWILGTGLELLLDIIRESQPTQIMYMSEDGPQDVLESLREAAKSTPVFTLPSQPTEYTTRTAAHLRTMLYMSYFHLDAIDPGHGSWTSTSIASMAPWEIKYAGKNAGILGIMCLSEQPTSAMVRDTIDGTLLAIVVLDDLAGIIGKKSCERDLNKDAEHLRQNGYNDEEVIVSRSVTQDDRDLMKSFIIRTPEDIPYFDPEMTMALDPRYSYTIGLALVRGIDIKRRRLQLITPVSEGILRDIKASNKCIVLVSGKIDTPGWAYAEDMNLKTAIEGKNTNQQPSNDPEVDLEESEDDEKDERQADSQRMMKGHTEYTPWIERLHGDEGRGAGARVWRVRRDLGRNGSGK